MVRATNNIDNLNTYGLGIAQNGGGSDGQEYTFPNQSLNVTIFNRICF